MGTDTLRAAPVSRRTSSNEARPLLSTPPHSASCRGQALGDVRGPISHTGQVPREGDEKALAVTVPDSPQENSYQSVTQLHLNRSRHLLLGFLGSHCAL